MYILATSSNWFSKLVRQFFFLLDSIIYGAISKIYDLLITIARTSPLSQADILDMADRIYKLLAIFMVFKVTFSLIMYVVNPDDFSDKNKGVSKLGMNIVVSLSMLILTPYIFSYAYQLQTYILEDNSLATLIFGTSTKKEFFNTAGDDMAYMAMSPFFVPDDSFHELNACSNLTIEEGTGNDKRIVFNPECSGLNNDSDLTAKGGEYETTTSLLKFTKDNNQFTVDNLRVYVKGVNSKNVGLTFRQELATATDPETKEFIMDYSFIFSSVVGVIIVLLLVTYCMDIALRSIKLAFLQLIAPIPIISYVDPKSGKDGLFKKWYQMCFKTYLSLFIRLIALYFAVYIISRVSEMHLVDVIDGSFQTNAFVAIFIIIGALMFAKQLPKILEGLGVKLDGGGFTLNPLKKMENDMFGGKQVSKFGKGVGKYTGRVAKGLGTGLLVGGASAMTKHGFRGFGKAMSGAWKGDKFGKNFSSSYSAAKERHRQLEEMEANGVTPSQVRKEKRYNAFHGTTRAEQVQQVADKSKAIQTSYDTIKSQAVACDSNDGNVLVRNGRQVKSAKTISKELDEMRKTQIERSSFHDVAGMTAQQQFDDAVRQKDSQIAELEARKKSYLDRTSQISVESTKLRTERDSLNRSSFTNDNDYFEAIAAYNQRLAVLDEQKRSYEVTAVESEIATATAERDSLDVSNFEDIAGKTADEQYTEAIEQQKDAIKEKEADLEFRINALANGDIKVENDKGEEIASASKIIADAKETMIKLTESVNDTGKSLDQEFEGISVEPDADGRFNVVNAMKQSKGTAAQATTGKLSEIKDIAQYTKKNK